MFIMCIKVSCISQTERPYSTSLCPEVLSYLEGPAQCTAELALISVRKREISL